MLPGYVLPNALADAGQTPRRMFSADSRMVVVRDSAENARAQWSSVTEQPRDKFATLSAPMEKANNDALAFMTFPGAHSSQILSTNPLERRNSQVKRRVNVAGIFPNDASIVRLVDAIMLEQNHERRLDRRRMQPAGPQTVSDTVRGRFDGRQWPVEQCTSQLFPDYAVTPRAGTPSQAMAGPPPVRANLGGIGCRFGRLSAEGPWAV